MSKNRTLFGSVVEEESFEINLPPEAFNEVMDAQEHLADLPQFDAAISKDINSLHYLMPIPKDALPEVVIQLPPPANEYVKIDVRGGILAQGVVVHRKEAMPEDVFIDFGHMKKFAEMGYIKFFGGHYDGVTAKPHDIDTMQEKCLTYFSEIDPNFDPSKPPADDKKPQIIKVPVGHEMKPR